MADNDWNEILKAEDRIINNSDRKHRYHFNSLESMSEELAYRESMAKYREYDLTESLTGGSFVDSVKDRRLANALRQLTAKQLKVVELAHWQGYKGFEIAEMLGCTPANVSILLDKALKKLQQILTE